MLVCRKCKKLIMYAVLGCCEECLTPEVVAEEFEKQKAKIDGDTCDECGQTGIQGIRCQNCGARRKA